MRYPKRNFLFGWLVIQDKYVNIWGNSENKNYYGMSGYFVDINKMRRANNKN